MPFNAFEATSKRLKKSKPLNEGATSGAAKTPRVGVNKSDLEAQGEQYGWTVRPLTMLEINQMSSAELRWHEQFNAENLQNVFTTEANKQNNQEVMKVVGARRMWDGQASEEECAAAHAAGNEFANRYPAFVRHTENAKAIAGYMENNDLDGTKFESYVTAFEALAMEGTITLSPKDAGVGPEARLTGSELKSYPRLHLLLQPSRVLKPEDKLSADEYFAQTPELHDTRVPPLIAARNAKKAATEELMKRSESATTRSGSTSVTDYKLGKE
jgi:hypothetical protein